MKDAAAYEENQNSPRNEWREFEDYEYYWLAKSYFVDYLQDEGDPADVLIFSDGQIGRLRKRYEFRGRAAVEDFLRENPFLVSLLSDAFVSIRKYFGSGTRAVLQVIKDPEAQADRRLFVFIPTRLRPKEARIRLKSLDKGWWINALPEARGKVTISLEYV